MTPRGMAEAIMAAHEAAYGTVTEGRTEMIEYLTILSTGITGYIKANAAVLPGTFSNSAGPVAGAGTIN